MAAQSFSGSGHPDVVRFTTPAGADDLRQLNVKSGSKKLSLQFITNAGKVAFTGTDDAAIGSHYVTIPADTIVEFDVSRLSSVFVTSATGATTVEAVIE